MNFSWIVNFGKDAKIPIKGRVHHRGISIPQEQQYFILARVLSFILLALALLYLIEMTKLSTLISLKFSIYVILRLPCDEVDKFLYNSLILFSQDFPKGKHFQWEIFNTKMKGLGWCSRWKAGLWGITECVPMLSYFFPKYYHLKHRL